MHSVQTVSVNTHTKSYDILIGSDLLDRLAAFYPKPQQPDEPVLLVMDTHTCALFGDTVIGQLEEMQYQVHTIVFTPGEQSKTWLCVNQIHEKAFRAGLTRDDHFIALGGGVIGDLTGFAASTYMRGIDYVQIPTTLLAQIDAAVGGKTAINTDFGRNIVGTYYQPGFILCDRKTLTTLSPRQLNSGMAEVIKYALLDGEATWQKLNDLPQGILPQEILADAIRHKAQIVSQDEREEGDRVFLNLGRSFAHALEEATHYERYTHGEAVAIGLVAALRLGEQAARTPLHILPAVLALLQRWHLPTATDVELKAVLEHLQADKKSTPHGMNFVLLENFGQATLYEVPAAKLPSFAACLQGFVFGVPTEQAETLKIYPSDLIGQVLPPPSKSQTHRSIICTALALRGTGEDFQSYLTNLGEAGSADIQSTSRNIRLLLAKADAPAADPDQEKDFLELDCGESGSTLRFMLPLAAVLGVPTRFVGHGSLLHRSFSGYARVLASHGVTCRCSHPDGPFLPLELEGKLEAGDYVLEGDTCAPYITGMLLAMCLLDKPSTLSLTTELASAPNIGLTLDTLRSFGQKIEETWISGKLTYQVTPQGGFVKPRQSFLLERDYSLAALWYLAAYMGNPVEVVGMRKESKQDERAVVALLDSMQQKRKASDFRGVIEIDVAPIPDLFPVLALAAALSGKGNTTRFVHADELKKKEAERLTGTLDLLQRLGVSCVNAEQYLEVEGKDRFRACSLDSHGDHRLAMVSALAALQADGPCLLKNAQVIDKSYPNFYRELIRLGAKIEFNPIPDGEQ